MTLCFEGKINKSVDIQVDASRYLRRCRCRTQIEHAYTYVGLGVELEHIGHRMEREEGKEAWEEEREAWESEWKVMEYLGRIRSGKEGLGRRQNNLGTNQK